MGGVQNIALRGMVEVTYWREGYPDQRGIIHRGTEKKELPTYLPLIVFDII